MNEEKKNAARAPGASPEEGEPAAPAEAVGAAGSSGARGTSALQPGDATDPGEPGPGTRKTGPGGPNVGETAAPSQQELAVRAALETVMDPEINLSVIDLGLIREIRFLDPPRTLVRMMLTTPFCPYAPQMVEDVRQAVTSVVPQECEVEILPDPWSPDLMPDPGLLGFSY